MRQRKTAQLRRVEHVQVAALEKLVKPHCEKVRETDLGPYEPRVFYPPRVCLAGLPYGLEHVVRLLYRRVVTVVFGQTGLAYLADLFKLVGRRVKACLAR